MIVLFVYDCVYYFVCDVIVIGFGFVGYIVVFYVVCV